MKIQRRTSIAFILIAFGALSTAAQNAPVIPPAKATSVSSLIPVNERVSAMPVAERVRLHAVPRRGIYVVRKTKREVIELITAWAALESMAARLLTEQAQVREIASLRSMFARFEN